MATQAEEEKEDLLYPDSDGKPIADNTLQFEWIVRLKNNLDYQYHDDPNVLVVGDLLWYAVHGEGEDYVLQIGNGAGKISQRKRGERAAIERVQGIGTSGNGLVESLAGFRVILLVKIQLAEFFVVPHRRIVDDLRFQLVDTRAAADPLEEISKQTNVRQGLDHHARCQPCPL